MKNPSFIKTDENRFINEKCILWVKQIDECLEVCMRANGCKPKHNTHTICKNITPDSYYKLQKHFQEE
jgi:hypothetical protein